MTKVKYGNIETEVQWQWPTRAIFEDWKRDFFCLEEAKFFNVYLLGGFLEQLDGKREYARDVDIILTGNENKVQIEKLIYEGTRLGILKYNVFFDILWLDRLPDYSDKQKEKSQTVKMYLLSDKWIIDGIVRKQYDNAVQVSENLWQMETKFPTFKQKQLLETGYVFSDPLLLSKE